MKFCSQCGRAVVLKVPDDDERPRHVCPSCGTIHYQNPKLVVGCIPSGRTILMCRRDIEPRRGTGPCRPASWKMGKPTAEGARRETIEETGSTGG
jgi:ribosomal protein S27AE